MPCGTSLITFKVKRAPKVNMKANRFSVKLNQKTKKVNDSAESVDCNFLFMLFRKNFKKILEIFEIEILQQIRVDLFAILKAAFDSRQSQLEQAVLPRPDQSTMERVLKK